MSNFVHFWQILTYPSNETYCFYVISSSSTQVLSLFDRWKWNLPLVRAALLSYNFFSTKFRKCNKKHRNFPSQSLKVILPFLGKSPEIILHLLYRAIMGQHPMIGMILVFKRDIQNGGYKIKEWSDPSPD